MIWILLITIFCYPFFKENDDKKNENEFVLSLLLEELPLKQAVNLACKLTQANKNELYDLALQLKNQQK